MDTTLDTTWHTALHVQYAENQDGGVLIDEDQGLRFVFNPTGNFIWKGLKKKRSVPQITKSLAFECQVSEEDICAVVEEFIADLRAKRLLLSTEDLQARIERARSESNGPFFGLRRLVSLLKWS